MSKNNISKKSKRSKTHEMNVVMTLEYRESAWGLERLVLDTLSNHIDAGKAEVLVKQDGKYVPLKEADKRKNVEEVVFSDNGKGYPYKLLSILFSTKSGMANLIYNFGNRATTIGQFGEGAKLAAGAALRGKVDLTYVSRNWTATPFVKPINVEGLKANELLFRVTEDDEEIYGSRTVFSNPCSELMDEIFQIPEKVLAFSGGYKVLHDFVKFDDEVDRILTLENGAKNLYVKGIRIKGMNSIYSYDLGMNKLCPDRTNVDYNEQMERIAVLIQGCTNEEVIQNLLLISHKDPDAVYDEFNALNRIQYEKNKLGGEDSSYVKEQYIEYNPGSKRLVKSIGDIIKIPKFKDKKIIFIDDLDQSGSMSSTTINDIVTAYSGLSKLDSEQKLWAQVFKKVFGEKAVLESLPADNEDAKHLGYTPIKLHSGLTNLLIKNGIECAKDVVKGSEYKWVDMNDLTLAERERLDYFQQLNRIILGTDEKVDLRVYSGLFTKAGRELASSNGVAVIPLDLSDMIKTAPLFKDVVRKLKKEKGYIGLKRALLSKPEDGDAVYIHELGHYATNGAMDYSREHTDFFVRALAKLAREKVKNEKSLLGA